MIMILDIKPIGTLSLVGIFEGQSGIIGFHTLAQTKICTADYAKSKSSIVNIQIIKDERSIPR